MKWRLAPLINNEYEHGGVIYIKTGYEISFTLEYVESETFFED